MLKPSYSRVRRTTARSDKGQLMGIAHRPQDGDPMSTIQEAVLEPGRGLTTENRKAGKREVTFLSADAWTSTCREIGQVLPWYARRANLLIDGMELATAVGKVLKVGGTRILIHGETAPCGIMDKQQEGLRRALKADCRGGVHGQVLTGGPIKVGDEVTVEKQDGEG